MSKLITKPQLPPKAGYVEIELPDGSRAYHKLPRPVDPDVQALQEQLAQSDETAINLFESQVAQEEVNVQQDESILALYETLEGSAT